MTTVHKSDVFTTPITRAHTADSEGRGESHPSSSTEPSTLCSSSSPSFTFNSPTAPPDRDTITILHFDKHDEANPRNGGGGGSDGEGNSSSSFSPPHQHGPEPEIVSFARGDAENPYNWGAAKKMYVALTCMMLVMNSTVGSSLPSGASAETSAAFGLGDDDDELLVLPISMYLMGYVMGPLVFAPLSESYGRKWVTLSTFVVFIAFNLGCALAPSFAGLVVMRLLVGIGASTPISVIGGIYADIFGSPKARGRALIMFMAATTWGPVVGPIISGFVSPVSWRWSYWVLLIFAGATFPFVLFMPETYGPVLLRRRAERLRKQSGNQNIVAPVELVDQTWREFAVVVLLRPVRMFLFEWIVLFSSLYLAVAYAIFFIYFEAYPIIFQGIYGFNAGEVGLTFLPIGVGAMGATLIYLWWDEYLAKAQSRASPPSWAFKEEFYRLPIGCLGAPLFAISLFWLGWAARPDVHWIVPTLSALPFGVGFLLIFMALTNYIVDAYEIFAASGMGASSCSRSIFGVVLPFAAKPMYEHLGVAWACTLLGFISLLMGVVPFLFIKYGAQIRANSKWCQELRRKKVEEEEKARQIEEEQGRSLQVLLHDPEKQV